MKKPLPPNLAPEYQIQLLLDETSHPTKESVFRLLYLHFFADLHRSLESSIRTSIPPLLRRFADDIANDATIDALLDVAKAISDGNHPKNMEIRQLLRRRSYCTKINQYRILGVPEKFRRSSSIASENICEAVEEPSPTRIVEICREFIERSCEFLTVLEKEVLDKLLDGQTTRQIAEGMCRSEHFVKKARWRIKSVFERFRLDDEIG